MRKKKSAHVVVIIMTTMKNATIMTMSITIMVKMMNMSIITTTMNTSIITTTMNTSIITTTMNTNIIMTMSAADMTMTTITNMTMKVIIMQTMYLQAGVLKHHINSQKKKWKQPSKHCLKQTNTDRYFSAKGMVAGADGQWIYFDLVPEEYEMRTGSPEYTGRICVIGTELKEDALKELFHI